MKTQLFIVSVIICTILFTLADHRYAHGGMTDEQYYEQYLIAHLQQMAKALSSGVDLRRYLWWSLLDNFEWDKGFNKRFGLIAIDGPKLERKIRRFAWSYAKICGDNQVDLSL